MDKKLNNLITFKEVGKLDKLENKPGKKVVENLSHIQRFDDFDIDEGFFTDTKVGNKIRKGAGFYTDEEKFDKAEQEILSHPVKREVYKKLKDEDPEKAEKYVEFFVKNPQGYPVWDEEKEEFIDSAKYSYHLGADFGAPTQQS